MPQRRQTRLTALDIVAFMLGAFSTVVPSVPLHGWLLGRHDLFWRLEVSQVHEFLLASIPFGRYPHYWYCCPSHGHHQPLRSADPDEDPKQFCKLEPHELECAGLGGEVGNTWWVQSCLVGQFSKQVGQLGFFFLGIWMGEKHERSWDKKHLGEMKVEWKGGFEVDSDDAILVSGLLHGSSTGGCWLMWSEIDEENQWTTKRVDMMRSYSWIQVRKSPTNPVLDTINMQTVFLFEACKHGSIDMIHIGSLGDFVGHLQTSYLEPSWEPFQHIQNLCCHLFEVVCWTMISSFHNITLAKHRVKICEN